MGKDLLFMYRYKMRVENPPIIKLIGYTKSSARAVRAKVKDQWNI